MSRFGQYNDTPSQIQNAGNEIIIKLLRHNDDTGIISWTIPDSIICHGQSPYNGILITLDTSPTDYSKQPTPGTIYEADPTADIAAHAGDKIGTSSVIGFFNNDTTTKSMVITGLVAGSTYYVSGFALDNIIQYHSEGVHAYSLPYGGMKKPDTVAYQLVKVGDDNGVELQSPTGFEIGKTYTIPMMLDYDKEHIFEFDGANIFTYEKLITEWNRQAALIDNPFMSAVIPNLNQYYYQVDTQQLAQWNGTSYTPVIVLVQSVAPTIQNVGDAWVHPTTKILSIWNGTIWVQTAYLINDHAPNDVQCGDVWYNNGDWFNWSGSVWSSVVGYHQTLDPALAPTLQCSTFWFDDVNEQLKEWDDCTNKWTVVLAQYSATNPATPASGHLWLNETNDKLYEYSGTQYDQVTVKVSATTQTILSIPSDTYWYNPSTMILYHNNGSALVTKDFLLWMYNPTQQLPKALWWNSTNDNLYQWNNVSDSWTLVHSFSINPLDPSLPDVLAKGTMWTVDLVNFFIWDGSEWLPQFVTVSTIEPSALPTQTLWYDTVAKSYKRYNGTAWTVLPVTILTHNPLVPVTGDFWMDSVNNILYQYNGTTYVVVPFSTTTLKPTKGFTYFDLTLNKLRKWNGQGWIDAEPKFTVSLAELNRYLRFETGLAGSYARVEVAYSEAGTRGYPQNHTVDDFFLKMVPMAVPLVPRRGGDGLQDIPSYMQVGPGLGSDGSADERRELLDSIRVQLGYPTIEVELTKQQMNTALDNALESFRKRSGSAYRRGFKFMKLEPGRQHYPLTDKRNGFNAIVTIDKIHRVSSAALSQSYGGFAGQGQLVLQQLYSAGSYDLISHHLIAQYVETLEMMFATQITFNWNEDDRTLAIYEYVHKSEMVLLEVSVERSEQTLLKDRFTKGWLQGRALVDCRLMLAEVRGKFSTLPGAGAGVSLNASELAARADADLIELYSQLDDYVANQPEEWGLGGAGICMG